VEEIKSKTLQEMYKQYICGLDYVHLQIESVSLQDMLSWPHDHPTDEILKERLELVSDELAERILLGEKEISTETNKNHKENPTK